MDSCKDYQIPCTASARLLQPRWRNLCCREEIQLQQRHEACFPWPWPGWSYLHSQSTWWQHHLHQWQRWWWRRQIQLCRDWCTKHADAKNEEEKRMRRTRDQSIQNLMNGKKDTGTHPPTPSSQQQWQSLGWHILGGHRIEENWDLWSSENCSRWAGNVLHHLLNPDLYHSLNLNTYALSLSGIRTRTEISSSLRHFHFPRHQATKALIGR